MNVHIPLTAVGGRTILLVRLHIYTCNFFLNFSGDLVLMHAFPAGPLRVRNSSVGPQLCAACSHDAVDLPVPVLRDLRSFRIQTALPPDLLSSLVLTFIPHLPDSVPHLH